jgi:hypothetical protein
VAQNPSQKWSLHKDVWMSHHVIANQTAYRKKRREFFMLREPLIEYVAQNDAKYAAYIKQIQKLFEQSLDSTQSEKQQQIDNVSKPLPRNKRNPNNKSFQTTLISFCLWE